jgi:hypothetical protein
MFNGNNPTARAVLQTSRNEDAVFVGWQKTTGGETLALYNITAAGHPSLGSTVTDKGLVKLNLQVPRTPPRPVKKF